MCFENKIILCELHKTSENHDKWDPDKWEQSQMSINGENINWELCVAEWTKSGNIANQRQNSWIISLKVKHLVLNNLSPIMVAHSTCIKKKILITDINQNLGDSVAEGTVTEPKCYFSTVTG